MINARRARYAQEQALDNQQDAAVPSNGRLYVPPPGDPYVYGPPYGSGYGYGNGNGGCDGGYRQRNNGGSNLLDALAGGLSAL